MNLSLLRRAPALLRATARPAATMVRTNAWDSPRCRRSRAALHIVAQGLHRHIRGECGIRRQPMGRAELDREARQRITFVTEIFTAATQGRTMPTAVEELPRTSTASSVVLDGHSLKIEDLAAIARARPALAVHPDAVARINKCRDLLERKIRAHEVMYGVNTGIGELSEVILTPEQAAKF